ncbi:hypothetical protein JVU11DRAFT_4327 [Chiua virens]|nr:hypothetical protein JVU11DRAFT_4327 [Chiua virens]
MGYPLPDELIGLTFNHLDVPSLLTCTQVCKLFHAIISGSTYLIYKIELFASYMDDNEHSSIDAVSRLNLLREHNRVWRNMSWPSSGTIPMQDGNCWEFSGGVLAQSTQQNELFLVQLPCKLKGIPERRWFVPFEFRIRDFAFDNSQDLVVLLELIGSPPTLSCKIHLRNSFGRTPSSSNSSTNNTCSAESACRFHLSDPDLWQSRRCPLL